MKTINLIGIAVALCVPALASAQRGGGATAVSVQRVESVQRVDTGRAITPVRDIEFARGDAARVGTVETGTRIRRPLHSPARRRWNAAHPPAPDPSRRRRGR